MFRCWIRITDFEFFILLETLMRDEGVLFSDMELGYDNIMMINRNDDY